MGDEFTDGAAKSLDYRGLRALFERRQVLQAWLDVEKALILAQAELNIVPREVAVKVAEKCHIDLLDEDRIEEDFRKSRHSLVPLINELVRICGEHLGGYIHWGVATQNIVQSGLLMQAQKAHKIFFNIFADILGHLGLLARMHAGSIMAGRTHGRHAVPITFGYKVAGWIEELFQAMERLEEAAARTFVVMMGGAAGSFSALDTHAIAMQGIVAKKLGMSEMALPSRAIRTHICEYVNAITLSASVFHRIADEIFISASEEFAEIREGFVEGSIGSSTMPQKVNPKLCYGIIANANKLYAYANMLLNVAHRPFEADGSTSLVFESSIGEVIAIASGVFVRAEALLANLYVDPKRMRQNLDLSEGSIFAELAMMRAGIKHGRHKTHQIMYDIAMNANKGEKTFLAAINEIEPEIRAEIGDILAGDKSLGACTDYALHFSSLALDYENTRQIVKNRLLRTKFC